MVRLFTICCLLLLIVGRSDAQSITEGCDSLKKGRRTAQPSVVFLPDTLITDSLHYEYTKLKNIAYRKWWSRQIYRWIVIGNSKSKIAIIEVENSEERFKPYQDKIIRDIIIKVMPPFGTNVTDTNDIHEDLDFLKSTANSLHKKSSLKFIRKQLTIRSGMKIDPFELVENELLLKDLSNIDDAMIRVVKVERDTNSVDLIVVCKDEFAWTGDFSTNFSSSFDIGIENKNLFSHGHVMHYEFIFKGNKEEKWGNLIEYKIPNIFSSRINLYLKYENTYKNDRYLFQVERPFITSKMRWAGGSLYSRIFSSKTLIDRDVERLVDLLNYQLVDNWGGFSFVLPERYSFNQNIYFTTRYTATRFRDRPKISDDTNHFYYDRDRLLCALTYMKIKYFKANLIYDFGRTEDIPSGLYGALLFGYEKNNYDKFVYLGTEWNYSWYNIEKDRFYSFYAALGSFFNGRKSESGVLQLESDYISRLYLFSRSRLRYYVNLNYTRGIKRFAGDNITFEDFNIYGFDSDEVVGNKRFSLSLSSTLFLPNMWWGFRNSISGYFDVGMLTKNDKFILKGEPYWGVGFSFNLRNDNLVFKNFNLRLTFYPKVPKDMKFIDLCASGRRKSGFFNFKVSAPEVVQYK